MHQPALHAEPQVPNMPATVAVPYPKARAADPMASVGAYEELSVEEPQQKRGKFRDAMHRIKKAFKRGGEPEMQVTELVEASASLDEKMREYVTARGGKKVIRRILIANNGMASTKTIMSIRNWAYTTFGDEHAVEFVVMATPEDLAANAEFIRRADEFVEVPGGSNVNNYANVPLIVDLAIRENVDAVMVGWGHASENPKLGDLLKQRSAELGRDITFVGPDSGVMRILGDKIASTLVAQDAGVSCMPWNGDGMSANLDGNKQIPQESFDNACITTEDQAVAEANRIGYPVMLKASEGGGGKGIRMASDEAALRAAYPQVIAEVPGSPVFLVTLCKGARHIEVQVVGDGQNAIALGGRDCSTQRRFQKIFEEGPPVIVPNDIFTDMMKAAVQLCKSLGYQSAGTVEYLYIPETGKYYFLELNPRLQVEHPVTEGITGVSLPATQIQVAMGIPLYNVPEVRSFYDMDYDGVGAFNLEVYKPFKDYPKHVIAARITAENPDEAFTPTSGRIERITFQSNPDVWGYFSVTADGGVHEYADSQFGHIFASGPTREIARKRLVVALKELTILGEIRTTVEYLEQLIETPDFVANTITTQWLDGLIAEKSVSVGVESDSAVINAAVYRAYKAIMSSINEFQDSLSQGQLSTLPLRDMQSIPVEISYLDTKYQFKAQLKAPDAMALKINDQTIDVKFREQADGSLYVAYGDESHQIFGKEEPLGLRMVLDGVTVVMPTLYDPSELRSDVSGKLVRYTVEEGGRVEAGQPFAEAEAMKMIITLKATESGTLSQEMQPGSIIGQGDLLASLTLADPSKVKKIGTFSGKLSYEQTKSAGESELRTFRKAKQNIELLLDGYDVDGEAAVQRLLSSLSSVALAIDEVADAASKLGQKMPADLDSKMQEVYSAALAQHVQGDDSAETEKLVADLHAAIEQYLESQIVEKRAGISATLQPVTDVIDQFAKGLRDNAIEVVSTMLQRYLDVEQQFVGQSTDSAIAALVKANPTDLSAVYKSALAHAQLAKRNALVVSLVRNLADFPERFGVPPLDESALPPSLKVVEKLAKELPGSSYKDVALTAAKFGLMKAEKPFEETVAELKSELMSKGSETAVLSRSVVSNALVELFEDAQVGDAARELAVKRWYRTYNILDTTPGSVGDIPTLEFKYQAADTSKENEAFPERYGLLASVKDMEALSNDLPKILEAYEGKGPAPYNSLHIALGKDASVTGSLAAEELSKRASQILGQYKTTLASKGVRIVSLTVPNPPKWPRQFSFLYSAGSNGYTEDPARRDFMPTLYNLLELDRLSAWDPERLSSMGHNTVVLLGTQGKKPRQQQRLFVRGITHQAAMDNPASAEAMLLKALDEVQLAVLDESVAPSASSHLFLHVLNPFPTEMGGPKAVVKHWQTMMTGFISKYATQLLKLRVDEIEVRAHVTGEDGKRQAVRLTASSMGGQWLKTDGYLEFLDPITGTTQAFCQVDDEEETCFLEPYPIASELATKRTIARRIGTTYAYDFLGLIEKALIADWSTAIKDGRHSEMPGELLQVDELLLGENGIEKGERVVGSNTVGMVGWHVMLKTPEYPEGRPLVIVANDCTVQSGSFGVKEDEFFDAVSKYSRKGGLPRLHIASNSGARIGLAEELKPYFKVAWNDPNNEAAGYRYLFLSEEDANRFGIENEIFHGEWVNEEGEKRFKLDDIVGQTDGIGVENLRGSGLIAGETSAAYEDTFTLSYVTGRSVGIGAYLNRLAQRVIQMKTGPMILTGFSALNKLLGKEVYVSQDQLGGPSIMMPNGIAHQLAEDDQDGVMKILRWLSYVPKTAADQVQMAPASDPVDRAVEYSPPNSPYDPRNMLAGATNVEGTFEPGFFDVGSFTEYMPDWGKSVVVGRARLGGIPMGIIAVETRLSEAVIPADPANPLSRAAVQAQAGQVWYPDSAFKTAQAIADFNAAENLPLMIFANWRGFSGGTRDMFGEVLKFGAQIVDNLRTYKHPVFAYIPPNGELRGGAWVVIDPTINEEMMEMYVDNDARGGILEPPGICDVKFRKPDLVMTMHRLDSKLQQLDAELAASEEAMMAGDEADSLRKAIAQREAQLMPLYVQISHEFADLHDRPGRMKAKGVIREIVPWKNAREYFFWRVRRRLAQDALVKKLKAADSELTHAACLTMIRNWIGGKASWEEDKAVLNFFESEGVTIDEKLGQVKEASVEKTVAGMLESLGPDAKAKILANLR